VALKKRIAGIFLSIIRGINLFWIVPLNTGDLIYKIIIGGWRFSEIPSKSPKDLHISTAVDLDPI
jgi:hypothetical protein